MCCCDTKIARSGILKYMSTQEFPHQLPEADLRTSENNDGAKLATVEQHYGRKVVEQILRWREKGAYVVATVLLAGLLAACGSPQEKEDTNARPINTLPATPTSQVMAAENPTSTPTETYTTEAYVAQTMTTERRIKNVASKTPIQSVVVDESEGAVQPEHNTEVSAGQDMMPEPDPESDPEPNPEPKDVIQPGHYIKVGEITLTLPAPEDGKIRIVAQGYGAPGQTERNALLAASMDAKRKITEYLNGSETIQLPGGRSLKLVAGELTMAEEVVSEIDPDTGAGRAVYGVYVQQ